MHSSRPDRWTIGPRLVALGLVVVLVVVAPATTTSAHSTLIAASPGPGDRVGGEVKHIDIVFSAGFSDHEVVVLAPGDVPIDGVATQKAFNWLSFETPGLEVEGQYIVRYEFRSADGDFTESAFAFTYDAAAPPPIPITMAEIDTGGRSWVFWAVSIGLLIVVAVLAGLLAERVRKLRSLS